MRCYIRSGSVYVSVRGRGGGAQLYHKGYVQGVSALRLVDCCAVQPIACLCGCDVVAERARVFVLDGP